MKNIYILGLIMGSFFMLQCLSIAFFKATGLKIMWLNAPPGAYAGNDSMFLLESIEATVKEAKLIKRREGQYAKYVESKK